MDCITYSTLCKWSLFCFLSLLTVWYTGLVSVLDNHVSVKQIMSIKKLKRIKYINYMCFEAHRTVYQGPAIAWSEGGGGGRIYHLF